MMPAAIAAGIARRTWNTQYRELESTAPRGATTAELAKEDASFEVSIRSWGERL
jgi:hypothetical protein